jgi:hypothetical protein
MGKGTLTIERRNVSSNATIYYSFAKNGKLRVDQDAGGGQIHTYLGDWKSSTSFFIVKTKKDPPQCFAVQNPNAVPEPQFFSTAKFMGRINIDGILTQHWCTSGRGDHGCKQDHHPNDINLYVKESDPTVPVRISYFTFRLDFTTFKAGYAGDPSVWDVPPQCHHINQPFADMLHLFSS